MNTSFRSDFMPDWLQPHPDHGVKALELGISNVQIFQVKILMTVSSQRIVRKQTHKTVIPLELDQHGFHALCDGILTLTHQIRHRLIHFYDFGLSARKDSLDLFIVPEVSRANREWLINSPGPDHHTRHV